jgi:hypothetical protein
MNALRFAKFRHWRMQYIYVIADIENAVATQSIHILGSPASKPATSYEQGPKTVFDD